MRASYNGCAASWKKYSWHYALHPVTSNTSAAHYTVLHIALVATNKYNQKVPRKPVNGQAIEGQMSAVGLCQPQHDNRCCG
jgi:hypothetical protein